MRSMLRCSPTFGLLVVVAGAALLGACAKGDAPATAKAAAVESETVGGSVSPRVMADALHTVMAADRTVYTKNVVQRLQNQDKVIKASEHWEDEKALPLPAQMFRMGAEMATKKSATFSYSLLSLWPINKQNKPKTELEKKGLQFVADNPGKNFYGTEALGGKSYFTGVYADTGVSAACVSCHNGHKDSPRKDFALGDVMGGVVIRIPVAS